MLPFIYHIADISSVTITHSHGSKLPTKREAAAAATFKIFEPAGRSWCRRQQFKAAPPKGLEYRLTSCADLSLMRCCDAVLTKREAVAAATFEIFERRAAVGAAGRILAAL